MLPILTQLELFLGPAPATWLWLVHQQVISSQALVVAADKTNQYFELTNGAGIVGSVKLGEPSELGTRRNEAQQGQRDHRPSRPSETWAEVITALQTLN